MEFPYRSSKARSASAADPRSKRVRGSAAWERKLLSSFNQSSSCFASARQYENQFPSFQSAVARNNFSPFEAQRLYLRDLYGSPASRVLLTMQHNPNTNGLTTSKPLDALVFTGVSSSPCLSFLLPKCLSISLLVQRRRLSQRSQAQSSTRLPTPLMVS